MKSTAGWPIGAEFAKATTVFKRVFCPIAEALTLNEMIFPAGQHLQDIVIIEVEGVAHFDAEMLSWLILH